MDPESNYKSDISENWSLIDINLNDESLTTIDKCSTTEKSHLPDLKNSIKKDEINLEDFKQDLETCKNTNRIQSPPSLEDDEKNDSGDAESIEILDVDSNYQEPEMDKIEMTNLDNYDFATYQSDDERSSDERVEKETRSNSSTVIKRKRKRISRNPPDILRCVHSMKISKSDKNKFSKGNNNSSLYKYYKDNIFYALMKLMLATIFAGVACLAFGHFIGVQDAAECAMELLDTLKKLQVENAALQSSMTHLKNALLTLETNPKLELPLSDHPHNKVSCEETPKDIPSKIQTQTLAKLNKVAPPVEIPSSLNANEWLSKLQNVAKKGTKTASAEIDIDGIEKHIHDQLNLLKEREKLGGALSEDADLLLVLKKLLLVLKNIMSRLSSSHDNIEVLHERLIKLKHMINYKFNRFFRNLSGARKRESQVPATELDLRKIDRTSENRIRENLEAKNPASKVLYEFPKPQKYYEIERNVENEKQTDLETKNSTGALQKDAYEKVEDAKKSKKKRKDNEKKKEKKLGKKNWKKENEKKKGKKRETTDGEFHANVENFKKKNRPVEYAKNGKTFDASDFPAKKRPKSDVKYKKRSKKVKNPKFGKVFRLKSKKRSDFIKNETIPFCSGPDCFNLTGYWIFKWADGRKEFRRYQTLSDWQFDRAKARKDVRDDVDPNNNWQFERAKARTEMRKDELNENWQFKRAVARETNRNHDRLQRPKLTKFTGKEFFQERFSWI